MNSPSIPPKNRRDAAGEHDPELATPRWVKVFGIVALVLILIFIILHITGNNLGGHGL